MVNGVVTSSVEVFGVVLAVLLVEVACSSSWLSKVLIGNDDGGPTHFTAPPMGVACCIWSKGESQCVVIRRYWEDMGVPKILGGFGVEGFFLGRRTPFSAEPTP